MMIPALVPKAGREVGWSMGCVVGRPEGDRYMGWEDGLEDGSKVGHEKGTPEGIVEGQ